MVEITVKGINKVKAKGRTYYYHRVTGTRIRAEFGTPAFLTEVEQLTGRTSSGVQTSRGTLGALIEGYRKSPEFTQLAARTRADYQKVFDYLQPLAGDALNEFDKRAIIEIRDAAFAKRKRRFANYTVAVLSLLFNWGVRRGLCESNPVRDTPKLRRPRSLPKANRRWTREELQIVLAAAPRELKLAIALAVCTGMREADVLRFPWSGYKDGYVTTRALKTGAPIEMPAHPLLRELADAAPRTSPVMVVGAKGQPFTGSGLRQRFFGLVRDLREKGLVGEGLTFHGLRTTCATLLAEAGCDTQTIMAITGHTTEAMVAHYTRDASRKGRAKAAIEKLEI